MLSKVKAVDQSLAFASQDDPAIVCTMFVLVLILADVFPKRDNLIKMYLIDTECINF